MLMQERRESYKRNKGNTSVPWMMRTRPNFDNGVCLMPGRHYYTYDTTDEGSCVRNTRKKLFATLKSWGIPWEVMNETSRTTRDGKLITITYRILETIDGRPCDII